ncbi:MAG: VanZ family protein [Oscillospiraceae bacterium]|nr:VanZ family protein [Oscillospiraceae bacterium]
MAYICYFAAGLLNVYWLLEGDELSTRTQMIIPVLAVAVAGVGLLFAVRGMTTDSRTAYSRRALWVLFIYYLAILSVLLFFGGLFHVDRAWGSAVNLEPFYTIRRFLIHYRRTGSLASLSNLLGNIVILIPLGILLPLMFRPLRRCWVTLPLMALFAVGVEYLQWCTRVGIADIDDSILNFAGAAAGYVLTRLCQMVYFRFKGAKR